MTSSDRHATKPWIALRTSARTSASSTGGFPAKTEEVQEKLTRIALFGILLYITIYALESPIRYGLYFLHANELILLRDFLIDIPFALILVQQVLKRQLRLWFMALMLIFAVQMCVFYINYRAAFPIIFGIKLLINLLLGLLIGEVVINPNNNVRRVVLTLFILECGALIIEKYVTPFPWVGIKVIIAGREVPISLDWLVTDAFSRRVGGLTRESINAAGLIPCLACLVIVWYRSLVVRFIVLSVMCFCVFLTTQKGALVGAVVMSSCLILPSKVRLMALRIGLLVMLAAQIIVPIATNGMVMAQGNGGVFSASSFSARVMITWPVTWRWIGDHTVGPLGVGIGGMGAPMSTIDPGLWQFPDNMFIFLIAYFGIFTFALYGAVISGVWRSFRIPREIAEPALAITLFAVSYGIVVSIVEDQFMSLVIGCAVGTLLKSPLIPRTIVTLRSSLMKTA